MNDLGLIPIKLDLWKQVAKLSPWATICQPCAKQVYPGLSAWRMGLFVTWLPLSFTSWHSYFTLYSPSMPHFLQSLKCVMHLQVSDSALAAHPICVPMTHLSFKTPWLKPALWTLPTPAPENNFALLFPLHLLPLLHWILHLIITYWQSCAQLWKGTMPGAEVLKKCC